MTSQGAPETQDVADVIRNRKTTKMLSSGPLAERDRREVVERLMEAAHWAPFHRACDSAHREGDATGIQPWRMVALDSATCRKLGQSLPAERAGKIPRMLAAADAMIQTTWLPNPPCKPLAEGQPFEPTLANMEHIAAASAAIQNLLLAATAEGIPNYWSSGGALLREPAAYATLGIPASEILLGSIFLFPTDITSLPSSVEIVGSKLRDQRSPQNTWSRWVEL
ncbi:MAG: hypothetical protein Aurels2KO_07010 [Aureliella sp.]